MDSSKFSNIEFWRKVRQVLLLLVDIIEREMELEHTTAEMRSYFKRSHSSHSKSEV